MGIEENLRKEFLKDLFFPRLPGTYSCIQLHSLGDDILISVTRVFSLESYLYLMLENIQKF